MSRFSKWAKHEYSERQRIFTLIGLAPIFLILIPIFLIITCQAIDRYYGFPGFDYGIPNIIIGLLLVIIGLTFGFWSNYVQFTIGHGTPVPMMPTQKLIICKPYSYCRNPMTFGAVFAYLGIAIWVGSLSAVGFVLLFGICLTAYLKLIEEKELYERYGQEYLEYKRVTPFLFPRLWKRNDKK
jgi:protein-S-isoprenylcysteine O-methyltransferase Ste14